MTAWAKRKAVGSRIITHSLIAHSADTGAVMERLLAIGTIADRVARLAGLATLDPITTARLAALAAIHDLGKANRGFQNKSGDDPGALQAGHIKPVVALMHPQNILSSRQAPAAHRLVVEAMGLERLFAWTEGYAHFAPVLDSVLMHHGRLPEPSPIQIEFWRPDGRDDPTTALEQLGAALGPWFPEAFDGKRPLAVTSRFLHAFAGLVMLADWIASDERYFPFLAAPDPGRMSAARGLADRAIRGFQLDPAVARAGLGPLTDLLAAVLGVGRNPRPAQAALARATVRPGSTIVLEAETGSGKTEAAIVHFLTLMKAGAVDGLYFALPTRAAAVQIHGRIVAALRSVLGAAAPPVVLAVPGYLRVDDQDGMKLPGFEVHWPDLPADRLQDRVWAAEHPKRYLAAAVAVGTVDQLMLGALNVRHAQLRSAPMLRQLLVIDEVHASDSYMERVICHLLEQHRAAGGHALLMSATLGAAARHRLLGGDPRMVRDLPPVEALAALPYPAVHSAAAAVPALMPVAGGPVKAISTELLEAEDGDHALAQRAAAAARDGARVLVIRNTVRDAQAVAALVAALTEDRPALAFRCNGVATVHHGRFAPADRRLLDSALEAALGLDSHHPVICVATQTAEQSLDIDADILFTDLCPADVLLQRLGRLQRHSRIARPAGYDRPQAVILAPTEDRLAALLGRDGAVRGRLLGLGRVYDNLVGLVATRRALQELGTLRIPEHNRLLVERATHGPALATLAEALGPAWACHLQTAIGAAQARAQIARLNLLDFQAAPVPPMDLDARIATRLGAENRLVHFEAPPTGPFGAAVADLVMPAWMVQGVPLEAEPELVPDPGGFTFSLSNRRFAYSQWGLSLAAT